MKHELDFYLDGMLFASRYSEVIPIVGDEVRLKTMVIYKVTRRVLVFNENAVALTRVALDIEEIT